MACAVLYSTLFCLLYTSLADIIVNYNVLLSCTLYHVYIRIDPKLFRVKFWSLAIKIITLMKMACKIIRIVI